MSLGVRLGMIAAMALPLLGCLASASQRRESAGEPSPVIREFSERAREYADLHRRLEALLPPLHDTESAEEIEEHRRSLVEVLRIARANARRGDIFMPDVAPRLRKIIRVELRETGTTALRTQSPDESAVPLAVNREYPKEQPLSSVPPLLLSRLPPLPEELEYRFVGPHLLLLDRKAKLIVDFLPNAALASR